MRKKQKHRINTISSDKKTASATHIGYAHTNYSALPGQRLLAPSPMYISFDQIDFYWAKTQHRYTNTVCTGKLANKLQVLAST